MNQDRDDTLAREEWEKIRWQAPSDVIAQGQKWLGKYGSTPFAGGVLAHLLKIKPSARLINRTQAWLKTLPECATAPMAVGALLSTVPSPAWFKSARLHLQEAEPKCLKAADP